MGLSKRSQAIRNHAYLVTLLEIGLQDWVIKHPYSDEGKNLRFVFQVESGNLEHGNLTFDYDDGVDKEIIYAAYAGSSLYPKEKAFTADMSNTTVSKLDTFKPHETILKGIKKFNLPDSLEEAIATSVSNLMYEVCTNVKVGIKIAYTSKSLVLFIKVQSGEITKVEIFLTDIKDSLNRIRDFKLSQTKSKVNTFINQRVNI